MSRSKTALLRSMAVVLGGTAAATAVAAAPAPAAPIAAEQSFLMLMCQYDDVSNEPQNRAWFEDLFGEVSDYYNDQSWGQVDLTVEVEDWTEMDVSQDDWKNRDDTKNRRWNKMQDCIDAHEERVGSAELAEWRTNDHLITVINAPSFNDSGASGSRIQIDTNTYDVAFLAHEVGHVLGLSHSWSDDTSQKLGGKGGEYDDGWDVMGRHQRYSPHFNGTWGDEPVGLNAFHRHQLGWLSDDDMVDVVGGTEKVTLAPVNSDPGPLPKMIRVFDPNDFHRYWVVEYRTRTGYSSGIPKDTLLIHEIEDGSKSILQRDLTKADRPPKQSLSEPVGIEITDQVGDLVQVSIFDGTQPKRVPTRPAAAPVSQVGISADVPTHVECLPEGDDGVNAPRHRRNQRGIATPVEVTFAGRIGVDGPGRVEYQWSPGGNGHVDFDEAGTKTVTRTITLRSIRGDGGPVTRVVTLTADGHGEALVAEFDYTIECTEPVPPTVLDLPEVSDPPDFGLSPLDNLLPVVPGLPRLFSFR